MTRGWMYSIENGSFLCSEPEEGCAQMIEVVVMPRYEHDALVASKPDTNYHPTRRDYFIAAAMSGGSGSGLVAYEAVQIADTVIARLEATHG